MKPVRIGRRLVGPGQPCWIVAEAGINHNGDRKIAFDLVRAAKKAGADAVKFQSFTPENLVGLDSPALDLLRKVRLTGRLEAELTRFSRKAGIPFFSTPFDEKCADRLTKLGVPAIKIGSGELTHLPLLRHVARKKIPVILSTGAGAIKEIDEAVAALLRHGARGRLILLHCVSNYPTLPEQANPRTIPFLADRYKLPVGFSDHTTGTDAAILAVAVGACVIEKHFTLNPKMWGPDQPLSAGPAAFKKMVGLIRDLEIRLGNYDKILHEPESFIHRIRRGIYARTAIRKGEKLTARNLVIRRPEGPMKPKDWDRILGRRARRALRAGRAITKGVL